MKSRFFPAQERGKSELSWLKSNFSFSFAEYYDPQKMEFETLRVLNDDWIAPSKGFWMHPHANMEIITIPLRWSISHKDSMGNVGIVSAWEVQSMSAGSGIFHSEINHNPREAVELFQIWIQTREKNITPQYSQAAYTLSAWTWTLLSAPLEQTWVARIHQDAYISRGKWEKGQHVTYTPYKKDNSLYLMNISGNITCLESILTARDALGIYPEWNSIEIHVLENSDILIIEIPLNSAQ